MANILIATQDNNSNDLLLSLCNKKKYKAIMIGSCSQIIKRIIEEEIDTLVLDYEICRLETPNVLLRLNEFSEGLPVILVAGELDFSEETKIRELGIFYLAKKPLNADEIERALQSSMDYVSEQHLEAEILSYQKQIAEYSDEEEMSEVNWLKSILKLIQSILRKISSIDKKISIVTSKIIPDRIVATVASGSTFSRQIEKSLTDSLQSCFAIKWF